MSEIPHAIPGYAWVPSPPLGQATLRSTELEETEQRTLSVFTEARFGCTDDGRWAAGDAANGPGAWEAYLRRVERVRIVARADKRRATASVPLPDRVELIPIPYYVSARQIPRRILPVAVSVVRAVRDSQTIVLRVPGVLGSIAAIACRLTRRPYAVDVAGDPAEVLRAGTLGPSGRLLAPLAGAYMRWIVGAASASRFVTEGALQARYPPANGTPTLGASGVRLGPGAIVAQPRTWRGGPFRLVTVGSQETHYKGHDVLLLALRHLVDDGLDVHVTIVGGGRLHDAYVQQASELGLASRVTFTGVVSDREHLVAHLDSADCFVLPSRTEGMPRALIEGMARALPAVASHVGGIPELLDPNALVPVEAHSELARSIARLITTPALYEAQSRRNLAVARRYDAALLDKAFSAWVGSIPSASPRARITR